MYGKSPCVATDANGNPTDVQHRVRDESGDADRRRDPRAADDATSDQSFGPDALYVNGYPGDVLANRAVLSDKKAT